MNTHHLSRRKFLTTSAAAAAGAIAFPYINIGAIGVDTPMKRTLGRTGYEVTTFGLGGQASIQWTPEGIDPEAIITKAIADYGVNYLDTSNAYGPSQDNFGKAFRTLDLIPGQAAYDEARRRSLCLASKTMIRHGKGSTPGVNDRTDGPPESKAADDIKRSLSQMFGDGQGGYPEGAYIDLFFIHNLNTLDEVDAIYAGYEEPDPEADRIGALAVLRDFRDGTNRTGLNPKEEQLIRGVGISGHISSPVMMECIQRDEEDLIESMLIAINANDRRYLSHQHNVIPVAHAKNMGLIGMKVFADGAMYTKDPHWSNRPEHVVQIVGSPELPSRPLVEYALTTPGIATTIIGIGRIDSDERNCQLAQNVSASQIAPNGHSDSDRESIEQLALEAGKGEVNWYQEAAQPLGAPRDVEVSRDEVTQIAWHTAYAAEHPITHYEIRRNGQAIGTVEHRPQTTKEPFVFEDTAAYIESATYTVVTVDRAGREATSDQIRV